MYRADLYIFLLLRRPQAFLLLSYFHLQTRDVRPNTFSFCPREIRDIGCKPVLTKAQVKKQLLFLEKNGYLLVNRESHRRPIIEITLLHGEFPDE